MFLVGKNIPEHITSLPQTVLDTPFGQMLKPQLDQALRGVTQAPIPPPARPNGINDNVSKQQKASVNGTSHVHGQVVDVVELAKLSDLLEKAKASCAAIFFTSSTCAPCKICYPVYDELAAEFEGKTTLIKVDINFARDIASQYQVRATPTFITFLNGSKLEEWAGADPAKLRANIKLLVQMAHPPHPHSQIRLPTLQRRHKPITYSKVPPLPKLLAKLQPAQSEHPSVASLKSFIEARNASSTTASAPVPNLHSISTFFRFATTSPEVSYPPFPLIDLLRLSLLDPRVSGFFAEEPTSSSLIYQLVTQASSLSADDIFTSSSPSPYPFLLTTTQALSNLFTTPLASRTLLSSPDYRTPLFELLSNLLSSTSAQNTPQESSLFSTATSLAFNISASIHNARWDASSSSSPSSKQPLEPLDESSQVEFLAPLLEALSREAERYAAQKESGKEEGPGSKESTKALLLSVGLLAYECSREGEVRDLLIAMEAKDTAKTLEGVGGCKEVAAEVGKVVD